MGRCEECNKDMGYFNGAGWGNSTCSRECEDKQKEKAIHYGDKVKVIKGFYANQQGTICGDYRYIGQSDEKTFCAAYGWKVKFDNGDEKYVDQFHIEKIL